ncbi:MAG: response regulator [Desulfovibrio sp.]|nr:response regulator [Desulfovibrio sp.]
MKTSFLRRKGQPNSMLIVDDDEMNCDVLANIFENDHDILTAQDGSEGLAILGRNRDKVCAILLDVMMPVMDGMEMLGHLADEEIPKKIPVFLITGETDNNVIKRAYDLGVMDVIPKPVTPHIVLRRVHSVMELFAARNHFADVVAQQTEELREQNKRLAEVSMGMIEALATATEFRSGESGEHVRRIHDITELFLKKSPLRDLYDDEQIQQIALASILHDVGKIAIPDGILNKPGRFTDEEFAIMKQHTVNGEKMLMQIAKIRDQPFYQHAKDIARYHHERWDGRGYPDGLKGDEIPLAAQIVSIADVYDALVSPRCYKSAFGHEEAVKMITEGKCGVFNPRLLGYFLNIESAILNLYQAKLMAAPMVEKHGCEPESKAS